MKFLLPYILCAIATFYWQLLISYKTEEDETEQPSKPPNRRPFISQEGIILGTSFTPYLKLIGYFFIRDEKDKTTVFCCLLCLFKSILMAIQICLQFLILLEKLGNELGWFSSVCQ